ncbi:hypothetical protein HYX12_02925, partial [Candidatus Woesearchaeota archaeon]|nr:hypothetical protein [Candidatus Woesearchaeota archaeon]
TTQDQETTRAISLNKTELEEEKSYSSKENIESTKRHGENKYFTPPRKSPISTSLEGCEEKEKVTFTHLPLSVEKITVIEPQGELTGYVSGHITPGDHVGFQYNKDAPAIPVYALADGYLVRVERNPGYFAIGVKNYHLYIEYSCSMFGSYVHVTEIAPELLDADTSFKELDKFTEENIPDNKRYRYLRIPVKAGQVLGNIEKWGLLGMLTVDTTVPSQGFVTPKIYEGEPWKVHAVPVFNYFSEELKQKVYLKNPRIIEPRGGKIDFDIPGKLVGNWFKEGTDYAGDRTNPYCGDYLCPYWNGHLAFVYDFVDPSQIRVSIGYDAQLENQGPYGIVGNTPDPSMISKDYGKVKYELVSLNDVTEQKGYKSQGKALVTENSNEVLGTVLLQIMDDNHIKMEIFPKKRASEVSGFSGKEQIYYR